MGTVYIVSNASGNLLWYPVTGAPSSDITHVYSYSAAVGAVTMGGNVYRIDITGTAPNYSGTFTQLTTGTNYYSQLSVNGSNLFALNASSSPQVATFTASNPAAPSVNSISTLAGDGTVKDIAALSGSSYIVVGDLGTIRKYSGTWNSSLLSTKPNNFNKVKALGGTSEIWIAAGDGNLYKSLDDAATFSMIPTGSVSKLTSLDISSSGQGMAAGSTSNVLLINSGVITQVNCGTTALVKDVISTGSGAGYIVTSDKNHPAALHQ